VTGLGLHIPLWDRLHLVINFFQIRLGLLWYHYKISQFYRRTNSVGVWLEVRRWFFYRCHPWRNKSVGFTFVGDSPFHRYISRKNKKTIYRRFYRRKVRAKKKRFPLEIYRRLFIPSVKLNLPTETIRRYIGRWNSKYRQNMSVCKFVGTCGSYC
jgi:putative component of membrane protein insertase Oxa1/YidC/SpoIIIJ protein YidD